MNFVEDSTFVKVLIVNTNIVDVGTFERVHHINYYMQTWCAVSNLRIQVFEEYKFHNAK